MIAVLFLFLLLNGAPAGYMPPAALEWESGGRSLLLRPRLRFPELLLGKGLEVDVEVEQALRDALFAESSQEDSGRIHFRFRLERKQ